MGANNATSFWTDERLQELRDRFEAKQTVGQIAEEFGVTRNAVCGKLGRLGLNRGRGGAKSQDEVVTMLLARRDRDIAAARLRRETARGGAIALRMIEAKQRKAIAGPAFACIDAADIVPRHVSLQDLERGECKWPYGDGPFTFCGHAVIDGPYCYGHTILSMPADRRVKRRVAA